jgi:ADP-L-glycero-D-manno-heptose 6-epimerase
MIIVTGGAGFIGSAIVWKLNQLGRDDIVVIDHLGTEEKWKNLVPLKFRDYLEKDDFLDLVSNDRFSSVFGFDQSGIEAIIHMGACSSTTQQDATYLVKNNFEYTKQLALFALRVDARFIYASSAATYGNGNKGFSDDEAGLDKLRPLNMYGYSKQLFDLWASQNGLLKKLVGLKFFNVFGPNEYHKGDMRSLIHKACGQILATGKIELFKSYKNDYADGEQMRDFIYVKDAVDMTLHFLTNKNSAGIFNIGSGVANTWNKLASAIFNALEKPMQIDYIDMPETIREKYQYHTCADISKIRKNGYEKEIIPIEKSVDDYVAKYLLGGKRLGE